MTSNLKFWQVDAFTDQPFKGNPAAVFILDEALSDDVMGQIAMEMNLSETAFVQKRPGQNPLLRWFLPTCYEIDLCGHATLASAHCWVAEAELDEAEVTFETLKVGSLTVKKGESGYTMNFPSRPGEPVDLADVPETILNALDPKVRPIAARKARDLMLVYKDASTVRNMTPDFNALLAYKDYIIVTARSDDTAFDFISRFFCADDGITEDPVTGSAHCTSAPYWAECLGKKNLRAYQASKRGGVLDLEVKKDRVLISGQAVTVMEGHLKLG